MLLLHIRIKGIIYKYVMVRKYARSLFRSCTLFNSTSFTSCSNSLLFLAVDPEFIVSNRVVI